QLELWTKCDPMHKAKLSRPPATRLLVAFSKHRGGDSVLLLTNGLESPGFGPHESMRWSFRVVGFAAKPWKADRNPTPDCLPILPARLRAEKKYFVVACWFPRSDLRPMQVNLALTMGAGDLHPGQATISLANSSHPWNLES